MISKRSQSAYQFNITLLESNPPIWRRIIVPEDFSLRDLHGVFQIAMGWTNSHLHMFLINGKTYARPDNEFENDDIDDTTVSLHDVLSEDVSELIYEYDFGDGWAHRVEVEKQVPLGGQDPQCLAGERACPPEDSGGMYGHEENLTILADPSHEDHEHIKEWMPEGYDPEAFDVDAVNKSLKTGEWKME